MRSMGEGYVSLLLTSQARRGCTYPTTTFGGPPPPMGEEQ
jgi:hypothetical protein